MLSEKEFIQAIHENRHIIYKVCNLYMDGKADRDDLFQEIVLNAWKSVPTFKGDSKFSTWIYRVALNTAITYFKKGLKKRAVLEAGLAKDEEFESGHKEEQLTAMNNAINELSDIDKALVSLYLDDYNYQEIAEIMGITVNNIAVKMNRIKTRLKESSKKYL